MRLSNKASTLFLNNLRIKGEIRTLFSQAPLPVQTEKNPRPREGPNETERQTLGRRQEPGMQNGCKALNTS